MMSFIKNSGAKLMLAVLAGSIFTAVVSATPLDFDDEGSTVLARAGTKYVGSTCTSNQECYSSYCKLISGTTKKTCQRQPLGGPCFRGGNCATRNCDKKTSTCVPKKQPAEVCSFDLQCTSGRCLTTLINRDQNGEILEPHVVETSPKKCDYLRVGQKGCVNYKSCVDGLCHNGYCVRGVDGDSCQFNYNCAGLCGFDGKCYTPTPKAQPNGKLCLGNDQCASGYCLFQAYTIQRPSLLDPTTNVTVTDGICADRGGYYYNGYGYGK
ncbi:unnamed protein product [Tilletia controversa]|nr:unnamed protein product [Tilletia caries]CAD6912453.1 unnamed protein product [Tilletia controversa]CAD6918518.1 unnamed protein product [Tilletia laevis]CAD6929107.1 unnamed protein product [Tilletia controversa]CAD6955591.1 unnamed protein product [Tilletia caries]